MLPVDAQRSPSAPSSRAIVAATATGRSLNDSVGFAASFFSHAPAPSSSGVPPSPSVTGGPLAGSDVR